MSPSTKPRLAGRQPSSRWGAPGEDLADPDPGGKREVPGAIRMTTTSRPTSTSGAWRDGDAVGARQFVRLGAVELERGGVLPDVTIAYETWGRLNAAGDNAVLVEHALTGDSHVVGPAGPGHPTPGWWDGLIGPGLPLDTDRYFVIATNVLGGCQGSTGPASAAPDGTAWGSRFPFLTVRDQVQAEALVADALGIDRF